jgi:hypothetical protein
MELSGDGYHADVIGEATPDFLLEEFVSFHFFYVLILHVEISSNRTSETLFVRIEPL